MSPSRPLRPCPVNGCPELVDKGRCPTHTLEQDRGRRQSEAWRKVRGTRGGMVDIYTTSRWRRLRQQVLREANYLCQCQDCASRPVPEPASVVDHVRPHRGDTGLMWSRANLVALSKQHHDAKTAREVHAGR
jgi:5-methylcytosine-specific restriction enzyme A